MEGKSEVDWVVQTHYYYYQHAKEQLMKNIKGSNPDLAYSGKECTFVRVSGAPNSFISNTVVFQRNGRLSLSGKLYCQVNAISLEFVHNWQNKYELTERKHQSKRS